MKENNTDSFEISDNKKINFQLENTIETDTEVEICETESDNCYLNFYLFILFLFLTLKYFYLIH